MNNESLKQENSFLKEMIRTYYQPEIERLNNIIKENIIKEAKEFIYENAYDSERQNCIDDLWGEIPKLLEILDKGD